jgi:tetratricopeptide (TPR) repeat protein
MRYTCAFATAALALAWLTLPVKAAEGDAVLQRQALALNDLTGEDPMTAEVKALAEDPAATKRLLKAAVDLARARKPQPFNYNAALVLAKSADQLNDLDAAAVFYRIVADNGKRLRSIDRMYQGYVGLIEVLYAAKKYDASLKVAREVVELDDPDNVEYLDGLKMLINRLRIPILAQQGKTGQALKLANSLVKTRPDWRNLELKAEVLHQDGQHAEAAKTYQEVMDKVRADTSLKAKEKERQVEACRYILSGVYVDLNEIDKSAEQLKALLTKHPDNPTFNNDLGYIWADHDMNLDEAEKLIRKALDEDRKLRKKARSLKPEADHDNAAYLDSLGWVLYKQKRYKEAKQPLLRAVQDKDEGQHTEIYEHLGDVYMALGERSAAIATYKKAVKVAGPSRREQEQKARVEKKLEKLR